MVNKDYDLIVIGGGSAGLTAAIGGAGIGARTLLIEKDALGGDCTHHGCVPSKSLIKSARIAREMREHKKFGFTKSSNTVSVDKILDKVQKTVKSIADHETPQEMKKYNIDTILGDASFVDETTVKVNGKEYSSKRIILAAGSRARVPPIPGIEKVDVMTNKTIFDPKKYSSLIVIGGGPIGCELSQAFAMLGIKVTLVNDRDQLLGREESEAARLVEKQFVEDGINVLLEKKVTKISQKGKVKQVMIEDVKTGKKQTLSADEILVATGRVPNIEGLNLEAARIEYNQRGVIVNAKGQSSNKRVYATGDIAGGFQFTHLANHHAKVALANLIFKTNMKYDTKVIPRVTFTTPEVASVGETNEEDSIVIKKEFSEVDRAITDSNTQGFFKFYLDKKGMIKGAVLVGEGSGELIGEVALAMKQNISIGKLAETIHPYPTYGYGLRHTADLFRARGYTEKKRNLVKKIFGLRGK